MTYTSWLDLSQRTSTQHAMADRWVAAERLAKSFDTSKTKPYRGNQPEVVGCGSRSAGLGLRTRDAVPHKRQIELQAMADFKFERRHCVVCGVAGLLSTQLTAVVEDEVELPGEFGVKVRRKHHRA